MSEKTAEEKLRQALEGSTATTSGKEQPESRKKPRPSRARPKTQSRTVRENLGERLDSFMDDFERRIEQSINAVKSPSENPKRREIPRRVKISAEKKPEPLPEIITVPKKEPEIKPAQEVLPVSETESLPVTEAENTQEVALTEPEILPEAPQVLPEPEAIQEAAPTVPEISQPIEDSQPVQEEIIPDVIPEEEIEPELPEIPVIEAEEVPQNEEGDLPDIPVISADDEDDDDSAEIFADELEELSAAEESENPGHEEETDEPEREAPIDFQEAELTESAGSDDDFAEIDIDTDTFSDEPLDEEEAEDDSGEMPGDFSPSADVVLSVDEDIPQNSAPAEENIDPESESVPVTVTMPESTKTAEDKLMADIAEAMTGNPLSLESQEAPAYNIPEKFFTDGMTSADSPQSAEDKLKANIVQALSESPIDTAQNQANQNLEEDISPFEELSIPENLTPPEEEAQPEESNDDEETLTAESHDDEEIFTPESDTVADNDREPQNDEEEQLNDPFTIPDFDDDDNGQEESEPEINFESSEEETKFFTDAFTEESDEEQESESEQETQESESLPEIETVPEEESNFDTVPEIEPEEEILPESVTEIETEEEPAPEIEAVPEEESPSETQTAANEDDMPFPVEESGNDTPMTEQEALIAMISQNFDAEENTNEEAQSEDNMPEQSLLNDETPGDFEPEEINDDFDISSLGDELGQAAVLADDEPDDFSAVPGTVTEMITEPENFTATAGAIKGAKNPEDDHKEKTMSIREKLASRKNANSDGTAPSGNSKSGLILMILTAALAVIGGLILWQLMTVSDKITSLAMNSPGYESSAGTETPSYDYAIDFILDPNLSDRMSQRGRAGWQVVGSRRTQDSTTGQYGYEFIFMRRTPGR